MTKTHHSFFWKCFWKTWVHMFIFVWKTMDIYEHSARALPESVLKGQADLEFFNEGPERIVDADDAEKDAQEDDEAIVGDGAPV